ncbi:MAG: 4-alpha-glucanotransferase [Desulfovibrionaceae bacterium]|nr:4-alpha-glucanotransferase [Desulfovibrionaceae bacterium]
MRCYGLLLHISSLPSAWGIGDLGPAAHAFAESLALSGASVWQFLPLNPTSTFIGNSPYSSPSAFAGNPLFISPELLARDGWLSYMDLDDSFMHLPGGRICSDPSRVDFEVVTMHREYVLSAAFKRAESSLPEHEDFQRFCREHHYWLHDYARFVSIKQAQGGRSWVDWPAGLKLRDHEALRHWDEQAARDMQREKFVQYLFFSQWQRLREACSKLGISLLADVPIYVTHDSVDVWANPHYFNLDEDMNPRTVSGVPPDYFSLTGQRWGTPVYNWDRLEQDGFCWWKQRLGHTLKLADMARLDHFRGFCAYWDIPAQEETAVCGEWVEAPAAPLFTALREHFGGLPFLAEDLGVITDDVRETMRAFGLPGMHVLQFAFGGENMAANPDIPHAHARNSFVYTGTHDNAPTRAWFIAAPEQECQNFKDYLGFMPAGDTAASALTRLAFAGVADCAVLPMQDALNLGPESRMNTPGTANGNWGWRMTPDQADPARFAWLKQLARVYGRLAEDEETIDR